MKKKIVQLVLFFITLALAFGSWFFLDRAFFSSWQGAPGLSFLFISLFFILLTLDFVVIDSSILFRLLLIFSLSISLFFVPNIFHLVSLFLVFLLLIFGQLLSQMEQKKRINLNFYRILFPAKFILVFALALVVSSQYFFVAKDKPVEEVIPQISLGENIVSSKILEKGSGFLGLESMTEDSGISVDEFILDTYVGNRELSSLEKQIILKEGRKNLSQIAKKDLEGDEEMSKVLPTVLNDKINQSLISIAAKNNLPVIQAILAIALFLAVISLGLIFSRVFIFLGYGIFWIMKKGKVVDVKKNKEQYQGRGWLFMCLAVFAVIFIDPVINGITNKLLELLGIKLGFLANIIGVVTSSAYIFSIPTLLYFGVKFIIKGEMLEKQEMKKKQSEIIDR